MKKKFSIWLNIVTICLCLCAIAIGVYAANTASLTVSGQIGFEAHGCSVKITNYTIANSSRTEGATAVTEDPISDYLASSTATEYTDFPTDGIEVSGTTAIPFNMGKFYFVDDLTLNKVPDIVITFNIHNTSAYPVTATMTESISTKYEDITVVGGTWTKTFGANDNATGGLDENTLSITLRLTDPYTADLSAVTEVSEMLSVTFTKDLGAHAEGELYVGEDGRLYVEYGNYPYVDQSAYIYDTEWNEVDGATMYGDNLKKPIRWVAFSNNLDAETPTALSGLTDVPTTGSYYFVAEYAFDTNHVFNSNYSTPTAGKNPNDYAVSEIRDYLKNGDFVAKFSLNNLVTAAQTTTLKTEEVTNFVQKDSANHPDYADGYITDGKATAIANCTDKLWLLSVAEEALVNTVMGTHVAYYPSQLDQMSAETPTEYGAPWWLRSPIAVSYLGARCVYNDGDVVDNGVYYECAVRPAFQLNLGA